MLAEALYQPAPLSISIFLEVIGMGRAEPVVEALGIHKVFGDLKVLRGIDLIVNPQELVFIIGPSGSGKSTLLRCCNLLEQPTKGTVRIAGQNSG